MSDHTVPWGVVKFISLIMSLSKRRNLDPSQTVQIDETWIAQFFTFIAGIMMEEDWTIDFLLGETMHLNTEIPSKFDSKECDRLKNKKNKRQQTFE